MSSVQTYTIDVRELADYLATITKTATGRTKAELWSDVCVGLTTAWKIQQNASRRGAGTNHGYTSTEAGLASVVTEALGINPAEDLAQLDAFIQAAGVPGGRTCETEIGKLCSGASDGDTFTFSSRADQQAQSWRSMFGL